MIILIILGAFVFWIVSFPMGGPLLDNLDLLPYFLLGHIAGFALNLFTKAIFPKVYPFLVIATGVLTVFYPTTEQELKPLVMSLIGFSSSYLAVLVGVILTENFKELGILGLSFGNLAMLLLLHAPLHQDYKFLILGLMPSLSFIGKPNFVHNEQAVNKSTWIRLLPRFFLLYLTGGLMYGVLMKVYHREAFLLGMEVVFYAFAVFACFLLLINRVSEELLITLSMLAFALSFFLMHFENKITLNLSMYGIQIGFGFADAFVLYSLVRLRNPLTAFPVGFGVICLAILTGYFVFKNLGNTEYVIALGNLLLVSIAVYLVYTKKSRSEETPMSQEASQVEITEQSETEYAQKTPENFLKELCESRAPYKKELSRREKEVLVLLLKGLIYHDISQALGISVSAVREYARRALEKLGLRKEELVNMYEEWKKNKDSMME